MKWKTVTAGILILLAATLSSGFQGNSEWIKFSPPGGRLSILLPAEPKETIDTRESASGSFVNHLFTAATNRGVYLVDWADYAPSMKIDAPTELAANRDNFVNALKAKVLSETAITLDGNPGIEFTAESDVLFFRSRVYVIGNRAYMVAAGFVKGSEDQPGIEKFLSSFEFKKEPESAPSHKP